MTARTSSFAEHAALMSTPGLHETRVRLYEEMTPLLAQRTRAGLWILLVAIGLFAPGGLGLARGNVLPFYVVKLVQLATVLAAFYGLRHEPTWRRSVWIAVAVASEVYVTTAISGILARDITSTVILFIVLSMGTAILLPWGLLPQIGTIATGAIAIAVAVYYSPGATLDPEPPMIAVALAFITSGYAVNRFEHDRLAYRLVEDRLRELRLAQKAGETLALPEVLARICRLTTELVPCDRCAIYLWSERLQAFVPAAEHGTPPEVVARLAERRHYRGRIQFEDELRAGKTVVLSRDDPRTPEAARGLEEAELYALAVVPLPDRDRGGGSVTLGLHRGPGFSEAALERARGVARYAVPLIENARLFAKLQKAATFRARVTELAAALNAETDPEAIVRLVCSHGAALLGASGGMVFMRQHDELVALGRGGSGPAESDALRLPLADPAGSPAVRAFHETRPLFVNDVRDVPLAGSVVMKSLVAVPLVDRTGPVGCLVYWHAEDRHRFSQAIAEEAMLLAGIAAAAIERGNFAEIEAARHRAEQAAEALTRQAAQLDQARTAALQVARIKAEFLANMSHEIRTPMTAILGYVNLLSNPNAPGDSVREEHLSTIRRNGEHLLRIINDILDLSKIEAGKMVVEHVECSLVQIIGDVTSLMRARATEKGLVFEVEYATPIPERITIDPTRLRQILINLVGNAIKFTDAGGVRLVIAMATDPAAARPLLRFDVVDTGCGIASDAQAKLFAAFAQADPSMSRRFGGTGLGLAISRRFAEMLGGEIALRSVPGRGSTFTLTVGTGPLEGIAMISAPGEALVTASDRAPSPAVPAAPLGGRILLAEDAPDNQRLLSFLLRDAGAEVEVVADGAVACEAAMAGPPFDVILMDMQMPVVDGYQATAWLRQMGYRGRIVALTAHAMEEDRLECLRAGCDDFITKPIDPDRLIENVRAHLEAAGTNGKRAERKAPLPSRLDGRPELAHLLVRFVEGLPGRALELEESFGRGDFTALVALAHKLKGTAGGYGFPSITEAAANLEVSAKAQLGTEEVRKRLDCVVDLCRRAVVAAPA